MLTAKVTRVRRGKKGMVYVYLKASEPPACLGIEDDTAWVWHIDDWEWAALEDWFKKTGV